VKKTLSILAVLLVVTAMLHVSVAHHFCGGELVASKISLSGALASCGMEGDEGNCPHEQSGEHIKSHCCDNVITSYSIDNNYTPASKAVAGFDQVKFQTPVISVENPVRIVFLAVRPLSDLSPPGQLMTSAVDLPAIRVFRI